MVISGNNLYFFTCFPVTSVSPFIWSSVLLKHGTSVVLCASTTDSLTPGDSCYLYVCFLLLARFLEVTVRSAYLLNQTGFLVTFHIFVLISLILGVTFTIFTLATFNPWPNRSVTWGWFVFPRIYTFLNITITRINIERLHLPSILDLFQFWLHQTYLSFSRWWFLFLWVHHSTYLWGIGFLCGYLAVISWLIWLIFLVINDFLAVLFLFRAM